jgi:cysteine desulfurase family protein (TIGR01976 family)
MSTPALHESIAKTFDIGWVREQFPSLQLKVNGQPAAFLDGPAGTQAPRQVMDAVQRYFREQNANTYGAFLTSRRTNEVIAGARSAMADFCNCSPDEVVFGQNMTTITLGLARAIGRELEPGDEILLTVLDHDANFSPWRVLEEKGVVIRKVDIRESDCTLDLDDLKSKLNAKTRLVAVGYASNAVGTINPVAEITKLAHAVGAMVYIDAVHYAPHGPIDVKALNCDFLVCSPYKFFGPHMGTLYGKKVHLERFKPYKVRPATDVVPECWETGTQVQELIAGITAAVDYIAELGRRCDPAEKTRR